MYINWIIVLWILISSNIDGFDVWAYLIRRRATQGYKSMKFDFLSPSSSLSLNLNIHDSNILALATQYFSLLKKKM